MNKKSTTKRPFVTFLLKGALYVAIVAGTILAINYFTNDNTKNLVDDFLGIDPNATTQQQEEKQADKPAGIAMPGFEKLVFQEKNLVQEVVFENPAQNNVYFIISLSIDDELIYESKLIGPGKGIYSIVLPKAYKAGEYIGKLTYETRSLANSNEKKNGAEMKVLIIFE